MPITLSGGAGSGYGAGAGSNYSTSLAQYLTPEKMPDVVPYQTPLFDQSKVNLYTQQFASPAVRNLRRALRETTMAGRSSFENPAITAMQQRGALEGYSTGLEQAVAGARKGALDVYGQEWGAQNLADRLAWQENVARARIPYLEQLSKQIQALATPPSGDGGFTEKRDTYSFRPAVKSSFDNYIQPEAWSDVGNTGWSQPREQSLGGSH